MRHPAHFQERLRSLQHAHQPTGASLGYLTNNLHALTLTEDGVCGQHRFVDEVCLFLFAVEMTQITDHNLVVYAHASP